MSGLVRISALDTTVELGFPERVAGAFVGSVAHAWSRCLLGGASSGEASVPKVSEPLVIDVPTDDSDEAIRSALQRLSQDVTHHLIAAQTGHFLMFRAGAVSHPETGASLVFVAPSGTGKTTLARLLGRTHGYLTDETVGIDPSTGRIYSYPKPLSIATGNGWRKVETSPDVLGLLPAHPSPTVARIVLLRRDDGPRRPARADELRVLDAVAALIPGTSALNRLPRPLRTIADLLDRTRPLLRLTYSEASDLVPLLFRICDDAV